VPFKLAPALLLAALTAYACGPRPPVGETHARKPESGSRSLTSKVDVNVGEGVALALSLTNDAARKVEVAFPSGLTHDFEVQDSVGRVVWRWSEGRLFTQAMQNRVLEREESVVYDAVWAPQNHHGEFVAVVSLKSSSHPIEHRAKFVLP
jgi:Intracellular proteinase inhibitor